MNDSQSTPKDFLIQPEQNNAVTLWVKGVPIKIYADRRSLHIVFGEEMTATVAADNRVTLSPVKPPEPTEYKLATAFAPGETVVLARVNQERLKGKRGLVKKVF